MRDTGLTPLYVKWGMFCIALLLPACGDVDTQARTKKGDSKLSETSQAIVKSEIITRQGNFEVTYAGDFNDPVCLAIKNTFNAFPNDVEIIARSGGKYPSDIFRLDVLVDALRKTNLPFIQWETVSINERQSAVFSAEWASAGYFKKLDSQTDTGEVKFSFHIFDEPHTSQDDAYITYDEWRTLPDVYIQESWPIKKSKLNEIYTLYDIKPEHPIQTFSGEQILNWKGESPPYFASDYDIIGPAIAMRYPFKNGPAEISLRNQLNYPDFIDNSNYRIIELVWDGKFLTAISFDDGISAVIHNIYSFKVTKFDSANFTSSDFFENYRKPTPITQIQAQQKDLLLNSKSVDMCEVTLPRKP